MVVVIDIVHRQHYLEHEMDPYSYYNPWYADHFFPLNIFYTYMNHLHCNDYLATNVLYKFYNMIETADIVN